MKVLMMILVVLVTGCKSKSETVISDPMPHCSDFTDYREVIEISKTTYQILVNKCNSIKEVVFSPAGTILNATKNITIKYSSDEFQTINYSGQSISFRVSTVISSSGSRVFFDYTYIEGDNFIEIITLPSHAVTYIYEGDKDYDYITKTINYNSVLAEAKEAIITL